MPAIVKAHPFVYLWADPADATKMKEQMEIAAANAIAASEPPVKTTPQAAYGSHHGRAATQGKHSPHRPAPSRYLPTSASRPMSSLTVEGRRWSSQGETTDHAGKVKYVTLIAQPDFNGVPKVLFKSVTDDDHLDLTPKMRLVDAVDARGQQSGRPGF